VGADESDDYFGLLLSRAHRENNTLRFGIFFTFTACQMEKRYFSGRKAVLYSSKSGTFPTEKYRFSFFG